jgi:hypothetical protein
MEKPSVSSLRSIRVIGFLLALSLAANGILLFQWRSAARDGGNVPTPHDDYFGTISVPDVFGEEFPYRWVDDDGGFHMWWERRDRVVDYSDGEKNFLLLVYAPKDYAEPIAVQTDGELAYSTSVDGKYQEFPDSAAAYRERDPASIPDGWMLPFKAQDTITIDTKGIRFTLDLHGIGRFGEIGVDLSKPGVRFVFFREREKPTM